MKSLPIKIIAVVLALLSFNNTKAQDNANCGIIIDGVIADSIPSWGFKELSIAIPMKQQWQKYPIITCDFIIVYDADPYYGLRRQEDISFRLTPAQIANYDDTQYLVFNVLNNNKESQIFKKYYANEYYCSDCAAKDSKSYVLKDATTFQKKMYFVMKGHTITGYEERLSNDNRTVQKIPLYDELKRKDNPDLYKQGDVIYQSKIISYSTCYCPYDKATYKKLLKTWSLEDNFMADCNECKENLAKVPLIPGKKFPFQTEEINGTKFSKVKIVSNTKAEEKINTTEIKKTVTKTTTTKTTTNSNTSSSALNASSLKPIDKSKAGYFVEKDGDIITKEGYKIKDDILNGEMRIYNSSGKLVYVKNYVNDIQTGFSGEYYENGQLMEGGMLNANGDKEGDWKEYDEKGKLVKTKKYKNGELQN